MRPMAPLNPFSIWAQLIITITGIAGGPGRAIVGPGAPSSRHHPRSVVGITATGRIFSATSAAIIAIHNGAISDQRNVHNRRAIADQSSGRLALFGDQKATDLRSDRRIVVDRVEAITVMTKVTVLTDKDRGGVGTNRVHL
ncbi:hypothetical protein A4H96_13250 [Acidithiobacillus ferrooxidans]|uniref:Uncharacterized protein n=1 Tax=Acidithiobacillus ferrooxidans TaxID=920 RepID=A0A179B779_ACIFR|nr:hypothetical protein A4H96_13250 [Acidithiobacillus ferrooxidans]